MDHLKRFNARDLHRLTAQSDSEFRGFLQEIGALRKSDAVDCPYGQAKSRIETPKDRRPELVCPKCEKSITEAIGTFFQDSKLSYQQNFELAYWWSVGQVEHSFLKQEVMPSTALSDSTIADCLSHIREVCTKAVLLDSDDGTAHIGRIGKFRDRKEFIWRKRNKDNPFFAFWRDVTKVYEISSLESYPAESRKRKIMDYEEAETNEHD